jgi:hypothetical protein
LIALAAVDLAVLAPHLVYADLGLDYPFRGGDTFDWLLNALALAGEPVRSSFRPPALPLALALLRALGWLSWFPVLSLALHHAAAVGTHLVLRRRFGRSAAFTCALLVLLNASVLQLALQVMADLPAAILLGASCAAFLAAGRRPGFYLLAGLLGGLSAVTQQAALLLPLPAGVTLLAFRREHLRSARLWLGAAAFAALPIAWFVAKRVLGGTFLDVGVRQWSLFGFHPENAPHYLVAALSFWGWPALLLVAAGAVVSVRDLARRRATPGDGAWALFPLATAALLLGFFALFYDFLAKRFLIYAFFPALVLLARSLSALRGTHAFVPAALLAVAIGVWPLPRPELPNSATLWPLPTVYSVVPTGHSFRDPVPRFREARVDVTGAGAALRRSTWSQVLRASRRRRPVAATVLPVMEDVSVTVFVAGSGSREPSAWRALTELGYLVHRPATYVPERLYPEDWWGWRGLEPAGVVKRYRMFHMRLPGTTETAAVAFARENPLGRAMGRRARRREDFEPAPKPERIREELALARGVAALHGGQRRRPLILLPDARGDWAHLLPFFVEAGFLLPDPAEAALLAKAAEGPGFEMTRLGPLRVARGDLDRVPVLLVLGAHPAEAYRSSSRSSISAFISRISSRWASRISSASLRTRGSAMRARSLVRIAIE